MEKIIKVKILNVDLFEEIFTLETDNEGCAIILDEVQNGSLDDRIVGVLGDSGMSLTLIKKLGIKNYVSFYYIYDRDVGDVFIPDLTVVSNFLPNPIELFKELIDPIESEIIEVKEENNKFILTLK